MYLPDADGGLPVGRVSPAADCPIFPIESFLLAYDVKSWLAFVLDTRVSIKERESGKAVGADG